MVVEYHEVKLADGRSVDVITSNSEFNTSGTAFVFHHGTPSDATLWIDWLQELTSRKLFGIACSRSGYSTSSRSRGRRVVDVVQDIQQILEHFKVSKFVSFGLSGGGPHCLADTTNPRCLGVFSIAGVGAYGVPDLNFLEGMGVENEEEFGAAVAGEQALTEWMDKNSVGFKNVIGGDIIQAFGTLVSPPDKEILTDQFAETFAANMRRALSVGYWGWFDDDMAFIQDWGFDIREIKQPVQIWQGDQDLMVPKAHGQWLASKIPNAKLVIKEGFAHLSIVKCKGLMIDAAVTLFS
jgi:pimeloyl-ACP methyl ester carboxylesterase